MRGRMPGMPKYVPLEGENHITGKVPGEPGYKPMTPAEAARFDKYGNETTPQPKGTSGGGGGGAGIPKVGPKRPLDMKKGGVTRADGCAIKGKTKGRMV